MNPLLGQFVSWGMAGAAMAAGTIPLIIHLLNRRRFKRVVWAAMEFLLAANRKNARRVKFEQWLLLAVRTLAIVLAGLALARPFLPESAPAQLIGRQAAVHVLVLDGSLSMQQPGAQAGQDAWQSALRSAERLVAQLPRTDRVALVVAAQPVRPVLATPTFADDAARLLKDLPASYAGANWAATADAVKASLADVTAAPGNRHVYLFTDLSGPDFSTQGAGSRGLADAIRSMADQAQLNVVDVAGSATENVAITDLSMVSPLLAAGSPAEVRVTVRNYGRRERSGLTVRLRRDDDFAGDLALPPLAAGQSQTVQAQVSFDRAGPARLEATLAAPADDAIKADNTRFLALAVRDKLAVLLVDGQPGSRPMAGAVGYLRVALAPRTGPNQATLVQPKVISELELPAEILEPYAAVYLANVRQLEPAQWQRLTEYVRGGGAVVTILGSAVNLDHYNRLAYADGAGVLPLRLDRLMEADAANTAGVGYWTFALADPNSPIVADFVNHRTGGLFTARVMRYVQAGAEATSGPANGTTTQPAGVTPILAYSNGAPALVTRPLGRGQTALLTTAANLGAGDQLWTNLPAKMDWVVLQQNLLANLLPREALERNVLVGQPLRLTLPAQLGAAPAVGGPDNTRLSATLERTATGWLAVLADPRLPGFYRFDLLPQAVTYAANVDTADSDLAHATEEQVRSAWGVPFAFQKGSAADQALALPGAPTREIGLTLLLIVLGLLLTETLLAQRFGHHAG